MPAGDDQLMFASGRERHRWILVAVVTAAIFSTIGLSGAITPLTSRQDLNAVTFVVGVLLVVSMAVIKGLSVRAVGARFVVATGLAAIVVFVLLRMASPVERSHLIEYGVLAVLIHEALLERNRARSPSTRPVPAPALVAIAMTGIIGIVDELVQLVVPSRVFDPIDIWFDLGAAVFAVVLAVGLGRLRRGQGRGQGHGQPEADSRARRTST